MHPKLKLYSRKQHIEILLKINYIQKFYTKIYKNCFHYGMLQHPAVSTSNLKKKQKSLSMIN